MNKMERKKLQSVLRIVIILFMLCLVLYAIVRFVPEAVVLLKSGNEQEMEAYMSQVGRRGIVILVALQFLQTITIVFPGIPIYMASGIVYGKIKGTIICYITYVLSNVIIFVASRRMGEAADDLFPNKKQGGIAELLNKTKSPAKLVATLCVLPVIPNGIIPHIAARSSLTLKRFFAAVAIGCIPGIFLFVYCGELLISGHYEIIIAVIIASSLGALLFFLFKNKIMKWVNTKFSNS